MVAGFLVEQRGPRVGRPLRGEGNLVRAFFLELRSVGHRAFTGDDALEVGAGVQLGLSVFLWRRRGGVSARAGAPLRIISQRR